MGSPNHEFFLPRSSRENFIAGYFIESVTFRETVAIKRWKTSGYTETLVDLTPEGAQQGPDKKKLIDQLLSNTPLMLQMIVADGPAWGKYGEALEICQAIQKASPKASEGVLQRFALAPQSTARSDRQSKTFKLHNIFGSNMVLQRGKPIKVWGWAKPGSKVAVKPGNETSEATTAAAAPVDMFGYEEAYKGLGKWEATFPPREASTEPVTLAAASGGETINLDNVLVGDVWVMSGQSNMAFPANKYDTKAPLPQSSEDWPVLRLGLFLLVSGLPSRLRSLRHLGGRRP